MEARTEGVEPRSVQKAISYQFSSPKANQKKSSQKQAVANLADQKNKQAAAAKKR